MLKLYPAKNRELIDYVITVLVLAFSFSFYFFTDVLIGSFLYMAVLVAVSFGVFIAVQKYWAKKFHIEVKYKLWWSFVILAIVITFLSNGAFVFAVLGVVAVKTMGQNRVGFVRLKAGPDDDAEIAATGPIACVLLAIISAGLHGITGIQMFEYLMMINLWVAFFTMLPVLRIIPTLFSKGLMLPSLEKNMYYTNGEVVFFGSRLTWVFLFSFICASAWMLTNMPSVLIAVALSFLIGFGIFLLWYFFMEKWERSPNP